MMSRSEDSAMSNTNDLFASIRSGDAAAVRAMLDAEPSLAGAKNEHGQSAVLASVYNNQPAIRDLIIARGITLDLHEAVAAGQLERVKHLVDANPDLSRAFSPD